MMNGYYGGMGWGGWLLMALAMVAFWALVVFAVVALFRGNSATSNIETGQPTDPRHILDDGFARGEIQFEEFQARKEALLDAKQPALTRHAR